MVCVCDLKKKKRKKIERFDKKGSRLLRSVPAGTLCVFFFGNLVVLV